MTNDHELDFKLDVLLLDKTLGYLGLIGSMHKARVFRSRLPQPRRALWDAHVRCPIGRRIPSKNPKAIAISIAAGADGVHLGQDDVPIKDARRMLGARAAIGVSCQSYEHARQAQSEGADYIGFGSVFKTLTKPERNPMNLDLLKKIVREIFIPVFAIGGVTLENIPALRAIGVRHFAVCRAVCTARSIREAVNDIKREISGEFELRG